MKIAKQMWTVGAMVLLFAGLALAQAAPSWMPNFPMRMGAAGAMLMWAPVPGATEYKVLRKLGDGAWKEEAKVPMNTYQDATAPQDQDVSYKVVPVIGGAAGAESPVVVLSGMKPMSAPSGFSFRLADNTVTVRWDLVPGAAFYNLYRGAKGEAASLLTSTRDGKHVDADAVDGKTYIYEVTAVSAASQESKRSAPLEVKVAYPKVVVEKVFQPKKRKMTLLRKTQGEDFAEFRLPTAVALHKGRVYVAEEFGVQVLNAAGEYQSRLPVVQEMVASGKWQRPLALAFHPKTDEIYLSNQGETVIRVLSPDGTRHLGDIVPPAIPGGPFKPAPESLTWGPDGKVWLIDQQTAQVLILPAGKPAPKPEEVVRVGWARGTPGDPPADALVLVGPGSGRFWAAKGLFAFVETTRGTVSFIDPASLALKSRIGGLGNGLQRMSSLVAFSEYDDDSLLVLDPMGRTVKRLAANGDYLETLTDNPDGLPLVAVESPGSMAWDAKTSTLYITGPFHNMLYIYQVEP